MIGRIFQITLILLLSLLSFRSAFAKGAPAMLTIKGLGISDVLEITDAGLLEPFGWGEFVDFDNPIPARTESNGGYIITRYVLVGSTTMRSLDTFTYYSGPGDVEGIVYYKGIIDKKFIYGGSPHDGKWFRVSAQGEAAIHKIFDTYNISTGKTLLSITIPASIHVWMIYSVILVLTGITIFLFQQRRS